MTLNLTIKHKLFAFSLLALSFVAGVAGSGYFGNKELTGALTDITTNFSALKNHLHADMMHDAIRADVLSALYASHISNMEQQQNAVAALQEHAGELRQNLQMNAALTLNDDIKKALEQVIPALESYITSADAIVAAASKDSATADAQLPAFMQSFKILEKDMAALSDVIHKNTQESQRQGEIAAERSRNVLAITAVVSFIVLLLLSYFLSKSIIDRLDHFKQYISEIAAQGDLVKRIPAAGNDEIARIIVTFNHFTEKLNETMRQFKVAAQTMVGSSNTLSAQASQAKINAAAQSDRVIQTSSVMEEMSASVGSVASSSQIAVEAATQTSSIAQTGRENMLKSIEITKKITGTVDSSTSQIDDLSKLVEKIGNVAGVIKSIADQTNLLALNAAIEAARAGEQGRGFAVVADEVRTLAARTSSSTTDITQMIALIQNATNASVESMERVAKEVATGLMYVQSTHTTLEEIVISTNNVTGQSLDIATATRQQSSAVADAARHMEELAANMAEHMHTFQAVDNTADLLKENAQELFRVIAQFKLAS